MMKFCFHRRCNFAFMLLACSTLLSLSRYSCNANSLEDQERLELPTQYRLHAFDNSQIEPKDFGRYSDFHWIRTAQKEMVFNLPQGTENTYDSAGVRVEAHGSAWWVPTNKTTQDWQMWEGTYRIDRVGGEDRAYCILQMKSPDPAIQWEFTINVENNEVNLVHRNRTRVPLIDQITEGEPFHIKAASNGRKYKVWFNGEQVSEKDHLIDPSGSSIYDFRWGIYKGGDTVCRETTRLVVYNIQYGLSNSNGILLRDVFENEMEGSDDILKVTGACDNWFRVSVNDRVLGVSDNWMTGASFYTYLQDSNTIFVDARDYRGPGVGGFLMELEYNSQRIGTDGLWEVSLDRINWFPATEYGPYGSPPWRQRVEGMPNDTDAKWIWSDNNTNDNRVFIRCTLKKQLILTEPE